MQRELTAHPERRITIEQLSRQYLLNPTTLKSVFKSVYGMPVASYMKAYRMKLAAGLLLQGELNVAEVAARVGYENQSKFAHAFERAFDMMPTVYRRSHRSALRAGEK